MKQFTILDLLDLDLKDQNRLYLKCLSGRSGLGRKIVTSDISRPGLALTGFTEMFEGKRVQLLGKSENAYLKKLCKENKLENIRKFFEYNIPCCVITHGIVPPEPFLKIAKECNCPILQTTLSSADFMPRLVRAMLEMFSPQVIIHGVLVEVSGLGVLLLGDSGVGKSETALALIEKGHKLIVDDSVEITCSNGNILMGKSSTEILNHHMEIRGLGIINIKEIFGIRAIMKSKRVQLVVKLEEWNSSKNYDRIGKDEKYEILGVHVPILEIPVKPGRNIPTIIETAALNERLKRSGHNSSGEFNKNIIKWLEHENARTKYMENRFN
ncbi:HPr kinase/phosphorylase [Thiospirochaeta perfilievii]|uniref:HPr kinase/phosphorylase n=1 Tax=Thiospirochaeta perfilievii TaxID=252967 RepID=A0A5C1Q9K6_9SPIO|nr:HPr(Ser) kinase/phosphatase [Thiospirochaeta perfilievii]QEN04813.1 HPr kinase/phosphorylase [Thiospirochaeta perfilievii]